jgi:hypothetical protein
MYDVYLYVWMQKVKKKDIQKERKELNTEKRMTERASKVEIL